MTRLERTFGCGYSADNGLPLKLTDAIVRALPAPKTGSEKITYDESVKGLASASPALALDPFGGTTGPKLAVSAIHHRALPDWKAGGGADRGCRTEEADRPRRRSARRYPSRFFGRPLRPLRCRLSAAQPCLHRVQLPAADRGRYPPFPGQAEGGRCHLFCGVSASRQLQPRSYTLCQLLHRLALEDAQPVDPLFYAGRQSVSLERNTEHKRRRYLSAEELGRLTLAQASRVASADIVRMLLLTGARRGETLAAKSGRHRSRPPAHGASQPQLNGT